MASTEINHSGSRAVVLYHPQQSSTEFLQAEIERRTNEVFKKSIELAKFENSHLCPIDLNSMGLDAQEIVQARGRRFEHVLPPLTGSFSVGNTRLMIQRSKQVLGDSEIEIEIYAPTRVNKDKLFFLRKEAKLDQVLFSTEQLNSLFSHSSFQLEPIEKMPVLIFSHGFGVDPIQYRLLCENIASHGYVVLNLNHPSSSAFAPFSEDALKNDFMRLSSSEFVDYTDRLAHIQESNIQFVIDLLQHNDLLKYYIDADKIMLAGHSLGGESSIIVANQNPKIAGCINLDGLAGNKETRQKGLQEVPVLTILSDKDYYLTSNTQEEEEKQQYIKEWTNFHKKSTNSEMLTLNKVEHMDFCLYYPITDWLLGKNELEMSLKTHVFTTYKMVEFMKSFL